MLNELPTRVTIDGRDWFIVENTFVPVVSGGDDDDPGDPGGETDPPEPGDGGESKKPPPDPAAELAKWKALARKHEANAKANAGAAEELKAHKNAGKSETEKLQALLAERESEARAATIKALKLQVAADKGLPAQLAKFLPDLDDEVDMLAAADELLEASGSAATGGQPTRQNPKSTLTDPLGDDSAAASREALISSMLGKAAS